MSFPVKDVIAASVAIDRINEGFVKKHDDEVYAGKKKSNSQLLYRYFFENEQVEITGSDTEQAHATGEHPQVRSPPCVIGSQRCGAKV